MPLNRHQVTTRAYYQRTGETGARNLGEIVRATLAPEINRANYTRSVGGRKVAVVSAPSGIHWRWQLQLGEQLDAVIELLSLSSAGTVLPGTGVGSFIWPDIGFGLGQPDIGAQATLPYGNLTSWTYTGGGTPVQGTDWSVDARTGLIRILTEYWSGPGYLFTLDYTYAAGLNWFQLRQLRAPGTFYLHMFDAEQEVPLEMYQFAGEARFVPAGEATGEAPVEFSLELTAAGPVSVSWRR